MSKGIKVNKEFEREVIKMELQINFKNKPLGVNSDYLIPFVDDCLSDYGRGLLIDLICGLSVAGVIDYAEYNRLCSVVDRL
ncbi:hypothetical protein [Sedimentibacter sp.]|uniref:hypothetical protein n=1 Tax=Sedimentibacter sp. TaxID=1960295 RepID=UPI0028AEDC03|nr:hypothetical protein [Sedimentibacter sp.]